MHRVLAEALDARTDPDRKAWHTAHAAEGPDEEVAATLEHSANRARSRGGVAAAAAFSAYASEMTPDPSRRVTRALAAAQAKLQAGEHSAVLALLAVAESLLPLGELPAGWIFSGLRSWRPCAAAAKRLHLLLAELPSGSSRSTPGWHEKPTLKRFARRSSPAAS